MDWGIWVFLFFSPFLLAKFSVLDGTLDVLLNAVSYSFLPGCPRFSNRLRWSSGNSGIGEMTGITIATGTRTTVTASLTPSWF